MILDCTLRDGGYVNNWEFNSITANAIIDGLYESGIRWIEIGIMGTNSTPEKQTKFESFEDMKILLKNRKEDCYYAVMVTTSTADRFNFPECSCYTPDIIRIAYFKPELDKTIVLARKLMDLGYLVYMQAMATFMYTENELLDMVSKINALKPTAFYMVDSFSTMFPEDIRMMKECILSKLSKDIVLGLHAHNNIQMAFSNVQAFIENEKRDIIVDASIYGMGRGAGNVPLELIMNYLNVKFNSGYNISKIINLYQNYIMPIYKECPWGYSVPYFLTAIQEMNSAWGWYFMSHGIENAEVLNEALLRVPKEWKYTLNTAIGMRIISELNGNA